MDLISQNNPVVRAVADGLPTVVVTHPNGGFIVKVGTGAAAAYYLQAGASLECQAEFNANQCRHLFK